MRSALRGLILLGGSVLPAAGVVAAPPVHVAPRPVRPAPAPVAAPPSEVTPASAAVPEDPELQTLTDRVSQLSEIIAKDPQAPQAWRLQLEQAEDMLKIAARSKDDDRTTWLRMAVDSHYSAVILSPDGEQAAAKRLAQLPAEIGRGFPGSPLVSYAALQGVQADYSRVLARSGDHPEAAKEHLGHRLEQFGRDYPTAPEAQKALLDAAEISEALGKTDDARQIYRYMTEQYHGTPAGRKAAGALCRFGLAGEPMPLALPPLYCSDDRTAVPFDLKDLHGKLVVVYFWSSTSAQVADDFQTLRRLTDRFQDDGVEAVYVNMDADPATGRDFLNGRLLVGTHLYQRGGLEGPVAERYGLQTLPQTFLVGKDGKVIRNSLAPSQLEAELVGRFPRGGR